MKHLPYSSKWNINTALKKISHKQIKGPSEMLFLRYLPYTQAIKKHSRNDMIRTQNAAKYQSTSWYKYMPPWNKWNNMVSLYK